MGRRAKQRRQQVDFWIAHTELPRTAGHPFYERLNQLLEERGFDEFVECQCQRFYAETMGRPSRTPGRYFRRLFRRSRWRAWDRVAGRGFVGAAAVSGVGAERATSGSLDDFADAAVGRCGDASGGVRLGAGVCLLRLHCRKQDYHHYCLHPSRPLLPHYLHDDFASREFDSAAYGYDHDNHNGHGQQRQFDGDARRVLRPPAIPKWRRLQRTVWGRTAYLRPSGLRCKPRTVRFTAMTTTTI